MLVILIKVSYKSGQSKPALSKRLNKDIQKVQEYEVKAKDLIIVKSLAEQLLRPESTRKALVVHRE